MSDSDVKFSDADISKFLATPLQALKRFHVGPDTDYQISVINDKGEESPMTIVSGNQPQSVALYGTGAKATDVVLVNPFSDNYADRENRPWYISAINSGLDKAMENMLSTLITIAVESAKESDPTVEDKKSKKTTKSKSKKDKEQNKEEKGKEVTAPNRNAYHYLGTVAGDIDEKMLAELKSIRQNKALGSLCVIYYDKTERVAKVSSRIASSEEKQRSNFPNIRSKTWTVLRELFARITGTDPANISDLDTPPATNELPNLNATLRLYSKLVTRITKAMKDILNIDVVSMKEFDEQLALFNLFHARAKYAATAASLRSLDAEGNRIDSGTAITSAPPSNKVAESRPNAVLTDYLSSLESQRNAGASGYMLPQPTAYAPPGATAIPSKSTVSDILDRYQSNNIYPAGGTMYYS